MPESKSLAPDSEKIKGAVCREYDINEEDLLISKRGMTNEPRNTEIYLMRHLMGSKGSLKVGGNRSRIQHE